MVGIHQVWPYFAMLLAASAFAALPWFRAADRAPPQAGKRSDTLDGLRGFLALSVFASHVIVHHEYLRSGVWKPSPSAFYNTAGLLGICLFFMITGFLFWNKLLEAGGRPPWKALYIGRVFRLGPMYLVAVLTMIAIVAYRTGFQWRVPPSQAIASALGWLALGIVPPPPTLNGYADTGTILAGVTWTLFFEWLFYFSLPVSAWFVRRGRHLAFSAGLVALCLLTIAAASWNGGFEPGLKPRPILLLAILAELVLMLGAGMFVASLLHAGIGARVRWQRPLWSVVALLCLVALFATMISAAPRIGLAQLFLLCPLAGAFFFIVCSGNRLFGLLSWPASRRLSQLSYGIYLSQGLILVAVFAIPGTAAYAARGGLAFWSIYIGCALLLCASALLTYRYVEEPGIRIGKHIASRLGAKSDAGVPLPATT
ncbi:acyltransferase family protein [Lysobacter sp. CA196]|uniref:acyltransferase family protein n=1 Tax=Lysobacter sp. CA196 TaxID=3455606 RepID=UPI003F8D5B5C